MILVTATLGVAGVVATWHWTIDGYNAGIVAARLTREEPGRTPLPKGVGPGEPSWWRSNAGRVLAWSAYLDRTASDPGTTEEARSLFNRAAQASPLHPTVRYALARGLPGGTAAPPLSAALGQTRDVQTLTWAARQLFAAGKKEPALRAYGAALAMAAHSDIGRLSPPTFLDDPQVRRYGLPTEDLIASVIREMADRTDWTYRDWADAVPRQSVAALAVARVLRARHSPDADAALEVAVAEAESPPIATGREAALLLAVQAETSAMRSRWPEAEEQYRRAIEMTPDERTRRSWWMNIADLSLRQNEEPKRLKALELAKSSDPKDEITQRAVELQKASGVVAKRAAVKTVASGAKKGEARSSGGRVQ